ncbi:MAG: glycosyltransferase [Myxococcota bacterium]|nr:glycosyltransferase [Myxococcota bacterium]
MNIAVCIPIYNDWQSALQLLPQLDAVASRLPHRFDVLLVDDGSVEPVPASVETLISLARVSVLRLRRNLGHQRAIAIGLTHLYQNGTHDAVLIMDSDGEDNPEWIPALVGRCVVSNGTKVVFGARSRRSEGTGFRVGYQVFRLLHRWLVGIPVIGGNFSIVPRAALERLVFAHELWNHYVASVQRLKLPTDSVPAPRAKRIAGESKMNTVSLAVHGFCAIAAHAETAVVRWMVSMAILGVLVSLAGIWAGSLVTLAGFGLLGLAVLGLPLSLLTLVWRSNATFLPVRDCATFVVEEQEFQGSDIEDTKIVSAAT